MAKLHDIHCIQCGTVFKGTGQTVFCSNECMNQYNNYWDYNECDER